MDMSNNTWGIILGVIFVNYIWLKSDSSTTYVASSESYYMKMLLAFTKIQLWCKIISTAKQSLALRSAGRRMELRKQPRDK